jgi:hypothetical protein
LPPPRSSLSLKHITVEGGVIDADFCGEIKVLLKNNGSTPISITLGTRIARFIFEQHSTPLLQLKTTLPQSLRDKGVLAVQITVAGTTQTRSTVEPALAPIVLTMITFSS